MKRNRLLKLIQSFLFILLGLGFTACTNSNPEKMSGQFIGLDGANDGAQKLQVVLSVTGDGYLTGIWRSEGHIKEAHMIGELGLFSNEMTLKVLRGSCAGEFKGVFKLKGSEISGTLKDNALCLDRSFVFILKKDANNETIKM